MAGKNNLAAFGFLEGLQNGVEGALFSDNLEDIANSFSFDPLKEKIFFAHWHFLRSNWDSCFKILTDLLTHFSLASGNIFEQRDLCEAAFLRELVSDRLGISLLEKKYFDEIYPHLTRLEKLDLHFAFQTEAAGLLMARGLYKAAFAQLSEANSIECSKPWFWLFRASIISGICYQAVGQYSNSIHELRVQEKFLEMHATGSLYFALQRRKLSLLIESECYDEVELHIEQNEKRMFLCEDKSVKAMWFKELARYRTTVLGPGSSYGFWENFESSLKLAGISEDFLRPIEERCEVAILQNNLGEAKEIIEKALRETLKIGVPSAECVCLFAKARIHCHLREFGVAAETALEALRIAQVSDYRREQLRILFLLHSIAKNQADDRRAQALFSEICSHQALRNLPFHSGFIFHIRSLFQRGQDVISAYLKIQNQSELQKKVFAHWTVSYGYSILPHQSYKLVTFSETTLKSYSEFSSLPDLINSISLRCLACYFVAEGCIVDVRSTEIAQSVSLNLEKRPVSLLHALLKSGKKGMALREIHTLSWPHVAWRQERHAQGCYQLISECRALCNGMGLVLMLDEKIKKYHILASGNSVALALPAYSRARVRLSVKNNLRQQQILDELGRRQRASGSSLAAFLKITKQTLQPLLKKMEVEGKITLLGRGRYAYYVRTNGDSFDREIILK